MIGSLPSSHALGRRMSPGQIARGCLACALPQWYRHPHTSRGSIEFPILHPFIQILNLPMPTVKLLPRLTKSHLFKLVTDTAYRKRASSASYTLGGPGSPGSPIKKFGWEANLSAGTGQRGQGDPGKYRLGAYTKPGALGGNVFWYKMEHVGDNSYKFERITGFPACPKCKGTGGIVCPKCNGSGRILEGNFASSCNNCKSSKALKSGVVACECGGKHIANGSSVVADFSKW